MEPRTPGTSRPTDAGTVGVSEIWSYTDPTFTNVDLTGWSVEARDGGIGKVDEATNEVGASYVVVDTGPWIFGKQVVLPAGVIERIDPDTETVFVNRTKDEIKNAPEFDPDRGVTTDYRTDVGGYYTGR